MASPILFAAEMRAAYGETNRPRPRAARQGQGPADRLAAAANLAGLQGNLLERLNIGRRVRRRATRHGRAPGHRPALAETEPLRALDY